MLASRGMSSFCRLNVNTDLLFSSSGCQCILGSCERESEVDPFGISFSSLPFPTEHTSIQCNVDSD